MSNRRSLIAVAIALAMPATLPALASAATVSADANGTITLRDSAAETNSVTVTADGQDWVIDDAVTALTAGTGCTQPTANEARCPQGGSAPTAYLGGGDDTFTAPAEGGWIVYGEAGADRFTGGAGADTFFGGAGADTLAGGGGSDRLDGGPGDDTIDGGPGEDLVTYSSATGPVTVDLTAGTGGQDGEHDVLTGIEDVTASGTLTGDDGPNFLTGGTGADVITGNGGDDTLVGDVGDDTLAGDDGDDTIYGDTLFGDGGGSDHLSGGAGDDWLDGGPGAGDVVDGGDGNDIVNGGGKQNDALGGLTSDGADQIDGGPGVDVLDYGDRVLGVNVDLRRPSPQGEPGEGDSAVGVEGVYGGAGNDTLIGDGADNVLRGGAGNDTLDGQGGVNQLDCGDGTDTVTAGARDTVTACEGSPAPQGASQNQTPAPGGGQSQGPAPSVTHIASAPHAPAIKLRATTLKLGRDGKLALRLTASAAGTVTIGLTGGKVSYLKKSVTVKKGSSTLTVKLSASTTRKLRKHAKVKLKLTIGAMHANVTLKRA